MRLNVALFLAGYLTAAVPAAAQPPLPPPPPPPAPRTVLVFVDCRSGCDGTYIRKELDFVDHVRDKEVADVHILITTENAGGGGRQYTISFIGLRRFAGVNDTTGYLTTPDDSDDDVRRGLVRVLKLGLVRYVATTPIRESLNLSYSPPKEEAQAAQTAVDPWNFWVFRLRGSSNAYGEESSTSLRFNSSFTASRVTAPWKTSASFSGNYRRDRYSFEEEDEEDYISISRDASLNAQLIKSLGNHWGAGARIAASTSTYSNQERTLALVPAIEYNFYPYEESTRRQLTLTYSLPIKDFKYRELTVYGKTAETKLSHAFAVNWDTRQPWGSLDLELEYSQYLPDHEQYRISFDSSAEVRLFKGFSLNVGASASRIRDQIYLPAEGATQEEILLRLRQIATGYDFGFSVGFSYTFGSVYNNVVNTRLSSF
jgi:hypothetical protein